MKKRNQFIKRIGAFLCALVVTLSCVGVASPYYASGSCGYAIDLHNQFRNSIMDYGIEYEDNLPGVSSDYKFCTRFIFYNNANVVTCLLSNSPIVVKSEYDKDWKEYYLKGYFDLDNSVLYISTDACNTWSLLEESSGGVNYSAGSYYMGAYSFNWNGELNISSPSAVILDSNHPVYCEHGNVIFGEKEEVYSSSLGYIQGVERKTTYIRGALYNYDEDSKTYHWYHDLLSSAGIDLTSGDYVIRHYVSEATVKGYEKEDIVRMSDKFLMAEYDASKGYFSYLVKDYDTKLYELGYENLGFIDIYFRGYFVLEHHYFQIVNIATNEVGGYLHLYPRDADPDHFGVELEYEGLDNNFEVDSDAPSGNSKPSTGSGETIEDALVNADEPKLDDLQGVDEFIDSLEMYSEQIKGVVGGVSAFLGMFPPWLIGLVGFSLVMPFVVIVIKALRG